MGNKINSSVDSIEETPRLGGESPLRVSVVVTVKDDPEGERQLMGALAEQTVRADEVVVVRAGKGVYRSLKEFKGNVRVVSVGADCSRGKGRNIGVRMARNELVAVTDAGCRPRRDWIEKLVRCLKTDKSYKLAVAGGYRATARTDLQRVMAGFLVSENRERGVYKGPTLPRQGRTFLPASRSIAFTKKAWETVGGYPEEAVSGAEDLEFARRLAARPDVKMIYCPEAVVDWEPPASLGEFFRDIVKHTRGNVEVRYWPHLIKNFTVVLRWMVFLAFPWMIAIYLIITWLYKGPTLPWQGRTLAWLPIVQLAADGGVVWGLISGISGKLGKLGKLG